MCGKILHCNNNLNMQSDTKVFLEIDKLHTSSFNEKQNEGGAIKRNRYISPFSISRFLEIVK